MSTKEKDASREQIRLVENWLNMHALLQKEVSPLSMCTTYIQQTIHLTPYHVDHVLQLLCRKQIYVHVGTTDQLFMQQSTRYRFYNDVIMSVDRVKLTSFISIF